MPLTDRSTIRSSADGPLPTTMEFPSSSTRTGGWQRLAPSTHHGADGRSRPISSVHCEAVSSPFTPAAWHTTPSAPTDEGSSVATLVMAASSTMLYARCAERTARGLDALATTKIQPFHAVKAECDPT